MYQHQPEIEFASIDEARDVRDEFGSLLAEEDNWRKKTVSLAESAGMEAEDLAMRAADGMADLETGYNPADVGLTAHEKRRLDFSKVSAVEAKAAKAAARDAGVDDFISHYDPDLTVDENRTLFGQAAREERGRRMDQQRSNTSRLADAYREEQRGIEKHAIEGVKRGSAAAKSELREMGWSPGEIREIVSTGQVRAALTPGSTVRLTNGMKVTPRRWAKAKRSHEHRRVNAQNADESRQAPVTTDYDKWHRDPDRYDYPGVDTRRPVDSYLDSEDRDEFTSLTRRLWTWQPGTGRGL